MSVVVVGTVVASVVCFNVVVVGIVVTDTVVVDSVITWNPGIMKLATRVRIPIKARINQILPERYLIFMV